jgi:DNA-binding Xre family transcriptional regulator
MRQMRIDWKEVKKRMIDRDVPSLAKVAEATGLNKNTLSQNKIVFASSTVDKIAHFLDCSPLEIIKIVEVEEPPPGHRHQEVYLCQN